MQRPLVRKFYPTLIFLLVLWVPVLSCAELLLPAEEVLIFHVAALEENVFLIAAVDEELLYAENGIDDEEFYEDEYYEGIPDPLEPWNRFWFGVNDRFYFWIFKPIATGYNYVVPVGARVGIRNVFYNATFPVRFVNALLQAKPKIAGYELGRFFINTMVGLGGWFDVASREPELRSYDEDLGQTLGVWGIGHGFYLVWPLLGPSSLRDTIGRAGDAFMNPLNYIGIAAEIWLGLRGYEFLNAGSLRIGDYEDLKEAAIDPYTAIRDAYYQRRKAEVAK